MQELTWLKYKNCRGCQSYRKYSEISILHLSTNCQNFYNFKIDTDEVLKAANTKWNFLNFKPGLVGGHCIGVDPYYLAKNQLIKDTSRNDFI